MSEGKRSRTTKKKPPEHTVTKDTQANPKLHVRAGDLNTEMVKEMFIRSEFVEWSPFCASMKWNPNATRLKYPVADWVREKKTLLAQLQAEDISDAIFRHKPQWHKDVLKVLRESPQLIGSLESIFQYRMNQISRMINADIEAKNQALLNRTAFDELKDSIFLKNVKNSDIVSLSIAGKNILEAKQRAVLINNWSVNAAEEFSRPETIMQEGEQKGFQMELINGEKVSRDDLHRWFDEYVDKPSLPALPPETPEPKDPADENG